jgi:hypothetical protein
VKTKVANRSRYFSGLGKVAMARLDASPGSTCGAPQESTARACFEPRIPVKLILLMNTFEQIAERERQFLLPTYNRYPVVLTRGKGVFLYDLDEKRYLDFVSGLGVNALGHAHPRIVKAIR